MSQTSALVLALVVAGGLGSGQLVSSQSQAPAPPVAARGTVPAASVTTQTIGEAVCTAERLGSTLPTDRIGEPVGGVTLAAPMWVPETATIPAHCRMDGAIAPATPGPTARPINFRVLLPAVWSRRAAHLGGGGMNGSIPNLTGNPAGPMGATPLARGFATYGSDSGHQASFGRRGGAPPAAPAPAGPDTSNDWTLNDEAIRNLGYAQMKKTHDAAMVVLERAYGSRPAFNYYLGTSQGGREALTVAQRYPADYDGIVANVPIVGFSSLMLAPELIRIREKPAANWVTPAKVNAIRAEFIRQCDALDGLADGVINSYVACRAIFDVSMGAANRRPWATKRCPNGVDPNPADTSAAACLTDGQIGTLEFVYSRYRFSTPLANGVRTFGMWVPNTDPSGSGLIVPARYRGQEGAAADAPMHSHLGVLGVTGFLMGNPAANPLDYVEGGPLNARRETLSAWLDSTNPDLGPFAKRGGRMIVTIGTNDTLASPGAQLDYYQALVERMTQPTLDSFARLYVIPQAGHGLTGSAAASNGNGEPMAPMAIPSAFDRLELLIGWVEQKRAPGPQTVTAGQRSLPLCTYPTYPRYVSGPAADASSYRCQR